MLKQGVKVICRVISQLFWPAVELFAHRLKNYINFNGIITTAHWLGTALLLFHLFVVLLVLLNAVRFRSLDSLVSTASSICICRFVSIELPWQPERQLASKRL